MAILNALLARLIDGLLYPFENRPPLVGLAVVSLLAAVAMLAVVRATSDQPRIRAAKRALWACVLEIRLLGHDLRAVLRAAGEMVRHNATYLRLSLVPVLWMALPMGLVIAHLHFHYGYSGLDVGQPALVKVRVRDSTAGIVPVLTAPPGIRIETPAVWIPSLREVAWRIVAERPGDFELAVQVGGEVFTKTVRATGAIVRRSPLRPDGSLISQLLDPAERPLPAGAQVESIAVTYPLRDINVLGLRLHWTIVFFTLSLIFAWALRGRFNVVL